MRYGTPLLIGIALPLLGALFHPAPARPGEEDLIERLRAGKGAFEKECRKCHTIKWPLQETKERDDWKLTVNMMVSNGAALTEEQKALIVDYLSAKSLFEMRCSLCHGTDRPLSASKAPEGWIATVKRMGEKKPGHLSAEDIETIAAWLSLERPPD